MKLIRILIISLVLVLIPFVIVTIFTSNESFSIFKIGKNNDMTIKVKRTNGKIEELDFEDYIVGVIAGEIPPSFEKEAIKAQAVAARSYALYKMKKKTDDYDVVDTVSNQVYQDEKQLKEKWQDKYLENIKKMKDAVKETSHEYLTYNGEVIEAFFFSTSVGKTENSEEVFSEKLPYLRSVDSSWDYETSPVFNDTYIFKLEDFYQKLNLDYNKKLNFKVLETTSTGRNKKIKINDTEMDGREFASKLKLRSNYFTLKQVDNNINIQTTGYGHGVGMSQYGANGMAKKGYNYEEILSHYYKNTKIKKINKKDV